MVEVLGVVEEEVVEVVVVVEVEVVVEEVVSSGPHSPEGVIVSLRQF